MKTRKVARRKTAKTRAKGERVVQSRSQWKRRDEARRLRWLLVLLALLLTAMVGVGGYFLWTNLLGNGFPQGDAVSSLPAESLAQPEGNGRLPVYPDSFNLVLVNASHRLSEDFTVNLTEVEGVQVEERIARPLERMLADARAQGYQLKLVSGYVDEQEQEARYQEKVRALMAAGASKIKAEETAGTTVSRGGYSEYQTGMAVNLTKEGLADGGDFTRTEEYRWLLRSSILYGFIQRNPENKTQATGMAFEPGHFRYVGIDHAKTMRQLELCLEEYCTYVYRQTHW